MSRPAFPAGVRIVEVGPRDGLQNEAAAIDTAAKVALVDGLGDAGLRAIEVGAFVSPRWVPQMADTAEVFRRIRRLPGVQYSALVPNTTGLRRALEAEVSEIAIFAAASETFSRRNINQTMAESLATYAEVARDAAREGLRVRAYLSAAFGCPYEGAVQVAVVAEMTGRLLDLGAYEVAVSDTIGVAHPGQVWDVLERLEARVPLSQIALHLHDTRGTALVNVLAALQAGIATFDTAVGGLGGCPYAPGAAGNLATEDLTSMLNGLGITTGVELDRVIALSVSIEPLLGHELPSRLVQVLRRAGERP